MQGNSRSNPVVELDNPIRKYIGWHGNDGYWWLNDVNAPEGTPLAKIDKKFKFGILKSDQYKVKGKTTEGDKEIEWSSNTVTIPAMTKWDKIFIVKKGGEEFCRGTWREIKGQMPNRVKIRRLVHAVVPTKNGYELVEFQFKGLAFLNYGLAVEQFKKLGKNVEADLFWMVYTGADMVKGEFGEKPAPLFDTAPMKPEENEELLKLDKVLLDFITAKEAEAHAKELEEKSLAEDNLIAENREIRMAREQELKETEAQVLGADHYGDGTIEKNEDKAPMSEEVKQSLEAQATDEDDLPF